MASNKNFAINLWDKYELPETKRRHVTLVAKVALFLSEKCKEADSAIAINEHLLVSAALLHDIDKNIAKKPGEQHPDTGVRILREEGMGEVANLVKSHPLHAIVDPTLAPKTWEEKLLFLADKMVKSKIITVDERFRLWNDEHLPPKEQAILDTCYPKVKALEKEIFDFIKIRPEQVASIA